MEDADMPGADYGEYPKRAVLPLPQMGFFFNK